MRQLQVLIILSAMGTGVIVLPRRAAEFLPEGTQDGWIFAVGLTVLAMIVGALISAAVRAAQKVAEVARENARLGEGLSDEGSVHSAASLSEERNVHSSASAELDGESPSGSSSALMGAAAAPTEEMHVPSSPSFMESAAILLTKPVAIILGVIMWVKLVFAAGLELRIFLEISREVMLPNTPVFIVSAVMLATCAYAAAKGMETRARVAEVLFGLMVLPFIFLFVVAIMDADFSNLQPMFVADARSMVYGSIRLGFILTGLECLLLVAPYVPRERSLMRAVVSAIGLAGLIITAISVITIASFGRGVASMPWPVLSMMDVIDLPGAFIERQEALMFGFWIITAFALANALLFFGGLLVHDIFNADFNYEATKPRRISFRTGVIATTIAVFAVSILPITRDQIYSYIDYMYMTTGAFFLVILPLVLLISAKLMGRNKKRNKNFAKTTAKVTSFILFLTLTLTTFAGCWDKVEIEKRAFVVAVGIDKAHSDDENDEKKYIVTLSVPMFYEKNENDNPMEENDNEDEKIPPPHIKTATGQTITEALKKLDAKNDKHLYYGQTKLLILGTSLLEDSELLQGAIYAMENKLEAPRRIHVLAAKDPKEILSTKPAGEILTGSYIAEIYRDKNKLGGTAFALDFERLAHHDHSEGAIIPKIERHKGELRLLGAVVMRDCEKKGRLSPDELQGFLWSFPSGNKGAVITTQNPENKHPCYVSMKIETHKANVAFENTSPPRVIVKIHATGTVYDLSEIAQESKETRKKLEAAFAQVISQEITTTVATLQKEYAVDGYNWKEHLRKKNYPLYTQHSENWQELFPKLEVIPQVTVELSP